MYSHTLRVTCNGFDLSYSVVGSSTRITKLSRCCLPFIFVSYLLVILASVLSQTKLAVMYVLENPTCCHGKIVSLWTVVHVFNILSKNNMRVT